MRNTKYYWHCCLCAYDTMCEFVVCTYTAYKNSDILLECTQNHHKYWKKQQNWNLVHYIPTEESETSNMYPLACFESLREWSHWPLEEFWTFMPKQKKDATITNTLRNKIQFWKHFMVQVTKAWSLGILLPVLSCQQSYRL